MPQTSPQTKARTGKARIGVLLALGESEGNKFELVSEAKRIPPRPWVKKADADFFIDRPDIKRKGGPIMPGCVGIPGDVSIAEYIKYKHGDQCEIDYINPEDISVERLRSNDVNFLLIYDLLEAFHTDPKGKVFQKFKDALQKVGNVYPNLEYQEFINSKLLYYNYFKERNLPIAPTITISKREWSSRVAQLAHKGGASAVAVEVLEEIQRQGFRKFIAKPVYGQEAKGCEIFVTEELKLTKFATFLRKNFEKYPGLIIQDFIKDFGDTKQSPELRMYFVGREYQFTAMATKKKTYTLQEDGVGGDLNLPSIIDINAMKALAFRAIDNMPPITMRRGQQDVELPRLLTRVDMGCIRDGVFNPWINEVEFVPSLYIEDHRCPLDALLGEQMVNITRQFLNLQAPRRSISDSPLRRHADSTMSTPRAKKHRIVSSPKSAEKTPGQNTRRALKLRSIGSPLSVRWGASKRMSAVSPKVTRHVLKMTKRSARP